jgi:hypothetical protein
VIIAFDVSLNEPHISEPGYMSSYFGIIEFRLFSNVCDPHCLLLEKKEDPVSMLVGELEQKIINSLRRRHLRDQPSL